MRGETAGELVLQSEPGLVSREPGDVKLAVKGPSDPVQALRELYLTGVGAQRKEHGSVQSPSASP